MDIKELKEFEVKLNQKLKGKSVDGNLLEELLIKMQWICMEQINLI